MSQKNETTVLIVSLVVTLALIGTGAWWFANRMGFEIGENGLGIGVGRPSSLEGRLSMGEQSLISANLTQQKQVGVSAIASGEYDLAVSELEASLQENPNDPEALIYLNNARIGERQSYAIAVSVPIETNENASLEILRGVAQAQNEVNQAGGINGVPLKVLIADDSNDPNIAQSIASNLVSNDDILGVVGHYASGVTLATADTYGNGELVAISPISTSVELSGYNPYIFRTVPSDYIAARSLVQHLQQTFNQDRVAVFYNSESDYSRSLKSEFVTAISLGGGQVVEEFDFSSGNFSASSSLSQAVSSGAEAIMLAADSATLDSALQVAAVNRQQLNVLGGDDVYDSKTLQVGGQNAEGMVVAIPWHILSDPNADFAQTSRQLWQGEVNWRTALSYDATKALSAAIERNPTREGIREVLVSPDFAASGASGSVRFLPSGDRNQTVQLVTVVAGNRTGFGYDFVPIP